MVKKNTTQLTFIAQAEIQVQEASPKEKKEKGTLMTFPMAKKKHTSQLTFHSSSPKSRCKKAFPKEKKKKGKLMTFPMTKNNKNPSS